MDGNRTQIEAITAEAARRGVTVTVICDFVHVLEYPWKAAWSFFDKGDPDAEGWVSEQAVRILHGKAARSRPGSAAAPPLSATRPPSAKAPTPARATSPPRNSTWKTPPPSQKAGRSPPAIEGACRHLVKDRMDITGARWGLDGAEAILKLRALITNGDFDQYWRYHLRKEHERGPIASYHESLTLAA